MSEFRLPELGDVGPATVSRWLKKPGDPLSPHDKLLEVFSARFDWDIRSPGTGTLQSIVAAEGAQLSAGAVLALLDGAVAEAEPVAPASSRTTRVSPLAARIAAEREIDLEQARGSGPDGRVSKEDVLALLETRSDGANSDVVRSQPAVPAPMREPSIKTAVQPAAAPAAAPADAQNVRPQTVTTFVAVDMSHVTTQSAARRAHWLQREGFALEYLPYIVLATTGALRAVPLTNGMPAAQGAPHAVGIRLQVVQASGSSLLDNAETLNLVGAARWLHAIEAGPGDSESHPLVIEDHAAGGALLSTGLLAPGAVGLLSVGSVHKQAVAIGEALQTRPVVYLGLTYDPHSVNEVVAGKFLAELKRLLEGVSFS